MLTSRFPEKEISQTFKIAAIKAIADHRQHVTELQVSLIKVVHGVAKSRPQVHAVKSVGNNHVPLPAVDEILALSRTAYDRFARGFRNACTPRHRLRETRDEG